LGHCLLLAVCPVLLTAPRAPAAEVVVIEGEYLGESFSSEAGAVGLYRDQVGRALEAVGVEYDLTTDGAVERAAVLERGYRVAILPYNGSITDGEALALERFVAGGGKLIVFYGLHPRLASLLGIGDLREASANGRPGALDRISLHAGQDEPIYGLPATLHQGSQVATAFRAASPDTRIIGHWSGSGRPPAVSLNARGVFVGHVLRAPAPEAGRLLLALIGHWLPEVWSPAVRRAIVSSAAIGRYATGAELSGAVGALPADWPGVAVMRRAADEASALRTEAARLAEQERYTAALDRCAQAAAALAAAYPALFPPREGELRGVWIQNPFAIADWGATCRELSRAGLNAVFVNMGNAGLAYYPSAHLPTDPRVAAQGDQVRRVLRACRRAGLELHVWRMDLRLSGNDAALEEIQHSGRAAVSSDGRPTNWLCPSQPANRRLELEAMLELARTYGVDGLHLDYIRYPDASYCYCTHCRWAFEQQRGHGVGEWPRDVLGGGELRAAWLGFRRETITSLVRDVSREVHAVRPETRLSAAVYPDWPGARDNIGQDALAWVEARLLDFVCPMDYTPKTAYLGELVRKQAEAVGGRIPIYVGLGAWRHPDAVTFVDQVQAAREVGADGFVAFSYENPQVRDFLTAAGRGPAGGRTFPPHWAPPIDFGLPPGLHPERPTTYRAGEPLRARVAIQLDPSPTARPGRGGDPMRSARPCGPAEVVLETCTGRRLATLGRLRVRDDAERMFLFTLPPGGARLAVYGGLEQPGGAPRPFVRRSAVLHGLSGEDYAALEATFRPPSPGGDGFKVGVTANGYGVAGILAALHEAGGMDVFPLHRLTPDFLGVCDVVVLAQLRDASQLTPEATGAVRGWVEAGGRLLLTHDACGFRGHPVLFPEVAEGAELHQTRKVELVSNAEWLPLEPAGTTFDHLYQDHVRLRVGPAGRVIAREPQEDGGAPLVIAGPVGEGWVVACGLVPGLGGKNEEMPLCGAERELVLACVRALGARGAGR